MQDEKVAKDCPAEITRQDGSVICRSLLSTEEIRIISSLLSTCNIKFDYVEQATSIKNKLKQMLVAQNEVEHQESKKNG